MTELDKLGRKKGGRPKKQQEDPSKKAGFVREPLITTRGKLELVNKDPNFYYYWVLSSTENGFEIDKYKRAGFMFVHPSEGVVATSQFDSRISDGSSVIRIPESNGSHLYLMKQPMIFRNEDLKLKKERIDSTEEALHYTNQDVEGLKSTGKIELGYK